MKYSSLNVSVELSCKKVANTVGYNLVIYITIWPIWPLTNMAQYGQYGQIFSAPGQGDTCRWAACRKAESSRRPPAPSWSCQPPNHLSSKRDPAPQTLGILTKREAGGEKNNWGLFFCSPSSQSLSRAPPPSHLLLIFSLSRWTRTCLGGLPVVLEVHLHNPEVFHDPAVPSQMEDRLKLLLQRLTDLDSLSSVLPNPSTLQQRLSCSFALFSSQRRASVFCSIITTHGW